MKPAIVHFKKHPYDIYIGRPSKWGNPFSRKAGLAKNKVATKSQALYEHKKWVLAQPQLVQQIKEELRGKILGCWCDSPYGCHGLILWQLANNISEEDIETHKETTLF